MSGGLRLPKFLEKMWWRGRKNLTQKLRCTCTRRWLTAGSWRRSSTLSMKTSSTCQASNSQKMWFVEQYVELLLHVWHKQCVRLISVYLIQAITFEMWVWCLYVWSALLILAAREAYFFCSDFPLLITGSSSRPSRGHKRGRYLGFCSTSPICPQDLQYSEK